MSLPAAQQSSTVVQGTLSSFGTNLLLAQPGCPERWGHNCAQRRNSGLATMPAIAGQIVGLYKFRCCPEQLEIGLWINSCLHLMSLHQTKDGRPAGLHASLRLAGPGSCTLQN